MKMLTKNHEVVHDLINLEYLINLSKLELHCITS